MSLLENPAWIMIRQPDGPGSDISLKAEVPGGIAYGELPVTDPEFSLAPFYAKRGIFGVAEVLREYYGCPVCVWFGDSDEPRAVQYVHEDRQVPIPPVGEPLVWDEP